jgi:hypothetical protein
MVPTATPSVGEREKTQTTAKRRKTAASPPVQSIVNNNTILCSAVTASTSVAQQEQQSVVALHVTEPILDIAPRVGQSSSSAGKLLITPSSHPAQQLCETLDVAYTSEMIKSPEKRDLKLRMFRELDWPVHRPLYGELAIRFKCDSTGSETGAKKQIRNEFLERFCSIYVELKQVM